jgi:hypothetical protein
LIHFTLPLEQNKKAFLFLRKAFVAKSLSLNLHFDSPSVPQRTGSFASPCYQGFALSVATIIKSEKKEVFKLIFKINL